MSPRALLAPTLLLVVVTLVALQKSLGYWLVPIILRRRAQALPLVPSPLEPVADPGELEPAMRAALDRWGGELAGLSFSPSPALRQRVPMEGVVQLHEHPVHGAVATIIVAQPERPGAEPVATLGFTTQLADGTRVTTGNSPLGSAFPELPRHVGGTFPGEQDAGRLYALHRAHVGRTGRAVPLRVGDPVAYQRRIEQRAREWWQECGYLYAEGGALRWTWKGAFLGSWRMQAPWKGRILARNESLRQQLLADAGLAG